MKPKFKPGDLIRYKPFMRAETRGSNAVALVISVGHKGIGEEPVCYVEWTAGAPKHFYDWVGESYIELVSSGNDK